MLVVAWLLVVLVGIIPVPAPLSAILPTIIWAVAVVICLILLLRLLAGLGPALP